VTRNLLAGARRDGVRILGYGSAVVTGNNIEGNVPVGVNVLAPVGAIDGTGNWWNDALGPTCSSGCDPASRGDSVNNATFTPFLNAPSSIVPPMPVPAPPVVLARAVAVAPAVSASRASSAVFPRAGRRPAAPVRAVPQGARGAVAEQWAAAERAREQLVAKRAESDQRLRARRAARESARQAAQAPPSAVRQQEVRP
jgi:hypothetical protein